MPTGRWSWTVTPKYAGWTGDESKQSATLEFTAVPAPEPPVLDANTSEVQPPAPAVTAGPPSTGPAPEAGQ